MKGAYHFLGQVRARFDFPESGRAWLIVDCEGQKKFIRKFRHGFRATEEYCSARIIDALQMDEESGSIHAAGHAEADSIGKRPGGTEKDSTVIVPLGFAGICLAERRSRRASEKNQARDAREEVVPEAHEWRHGTSSLSPGAPGVTRS